MGNAFGKPDSVRIEEIRVKLQRHIRNLTSQRNLFEQDESKILLKMQEKGKQGRINEVRLHAKDLIRTRKQVAIYSNTINNVSSFSRGLMNIQHTKDLISSTREVTSLMKTLNQEIKMPELNRTLREFAKQNALMSYTNDMVTDALDQADDDSNMTEEIDEEVDKILDQMGLAQMEKMDDVPRRHVDSHQQPQKQLDPSEEYNQKRQQELEEVMRDL